MTSLIAFHFKLSQKKFIWFPFIFLKPKADELITHRRVLMMAPCFGSYFFLFNGLRRLILESVIDFSWQSLAGFTLGFFFWFELVTRPLWNKYLTSVK